MKVKLATQEWSATVSSGINLYVRFRVIPPSAVPTSEVVQKFD